jgi:type IV pilus assembly protein PilM
MSFHSPIFHVKLTIKEKMVKKEDDIVATSKLLEVIRGKRESLREEESYPENASAEEIHGHKDSYIEELKEILPSESSLTELSVLDLPQDIIISSKKRKKIIGLKGISRIKVGLDIGSHSVKMVQIERGSNTHRLISFGLGEIFPEKLTSDAMVEAKIIAIKKVLKDIDIKKSLIVTSIDDPSIVIRQISMPRMSVKDIERAIPFEARKYIPYDPSKVKLSYQILGEGNKKGIQDIILVAIPKDLIEMHLSTLERAGIEPYIVDVGPLALSNVYSDIVKMKKDGKVVLLNLGAKITTLNIYTEDGPFFSRYIHISGNRFSREIENRLNVKLIEAEKLKRFPEAISLRMDPSIPPSKALIEVLRPALNRLLFEIRRSLTFFDNNSQKKGFEKVLIMGGGARIKGIERFLEDELMLPVEVFNPFKYLEVDGGIFPKNIVDEVGSQMAIAVGLALRK